MTIAEIREGVGKLRRKGATARADTFDAWLRSLLTVFGDRVLSFGIGEGGRCARRQCGLYRRHPCFADIATAATAKAHGLVLVTENLCHFEPLLAFGVAMHDLDGMAGPDWTSRR